MRIPALKCVLDDLGYLMDFVSGKHVANMFHEIQNKFRKIFGWVCGSGCG